MSNDQNLPINLKCPVFTPGVSGFYLKSWGKWTHFCSIYVKTKGLFLSGQPKPTIDQVNSTMSNPLRNFCQLFNYVLSFPTRVGGGRFSRKPNHLHSIDDFGLFRWENILSVVGRSCRYINIRVLYFRKI